MSAPFTVALDSLFASPLAVPVTYSPAFDDELAILAIPSQPDRLASWEGVTVQSPTMTFLVRREDVPNPQAGDRIFITSVDDGPEYIVQGLPQADDLALTWRLDTRPAA